MSPANILILAIRPSDAGGRASVKIKGPQPRFSYPGSARSLWPDSAAIGGGTWGQRLLYQLSREEPPPPFDRAIEPNRRDPRARAQRAAGDGVSRDAGVCGSRPASGLGPLARRVERVFAQFGAAQALPRHFRRAECAAAGEPAGIGG